MKAILLVSTAVVYGQSQARLRGASNVVFSTSAQGVVSANQEDGVLPRTLQDVDTLTAIAVDADSSSSIDGHGCCVKYQLKDQTMSNLAFEKTSLDKCPKGVREGENAPIGYKLMQEFKQLPCEATKIVYAQTQTDAGLFLSELSCFKPSIAYAKTAVNFLRKAQERAKENKAIADNKKSLASLEKVTESLNALANDPQAMNKTQVLNTASREQNLLQDAFDDFQKEYDQKVADEKKSFATQKKALETEIRNLQNDVSNGLRAIASVRNVIVGTRMAYETDATEATSVANYCSQPDPALKDSSEVGC